MGPPEAVDREFLYIAFLFCVCFGSRDFFFLPSAFFLLSSWQILPQLGSIWGHLGSILGSSWLHLEPSWPHLEPSWRHLGPTWLPRMCFWGLTITLSRSFWRWPSGMQYVCYFFFDIALYRGKSGIYFFKNRFPIRERAFRKNVTYDLSKTM